MWVKVVEWLLRKLVKGKLKDPPMTNCKKNPPVATKVKEKIHK